MYIHTLLIMSAGTGLDTSNRPASQHYNIQYAQYIYTCNYSNVHNYSNVTIASNCTSNGKKIYK